MTELENKRIKSELLRVQAAKAEMEYKVAERLDEVKRLEDNIKKQEKAELSLLERLQGVK